MSTKDRRGKRCAGTSGPPDRQSRAEADIALGHDLIEGFEPDAVLAGKGYDADKLCEAIETAGAEVVIPPKRNRTVQRPDNAELCKERNLIEHFFNKLKQFRRIARRYDKLPANFIGFVRLAALAIWIR